MLLLRHLNQRGDGHTILTVTDDGNEGALYTTAAPHGLVDSSSILISGVSDAHYNGARTIDTVPTPTTFLIFSFYTVDATGGTWVLN